MAAPKKNTTTTSKRTTKPKTEEAIKETAVPTATAEPVAEPIPPTTGSNATPAPQPVYQVVTPKDPMVKILYIDSAIEGNQIPIGKGRVISGSGRIFSVSLSDFEGEFMSPLVMLLIKKRKFIVLDGLTDEQRMQYGCLYKEDEVINNEGMFDWMLSCPINDAEERFANLCKTHRELVGRRIISAYEQRDHRINRDRLERLNAISKADYEDGKGIFTEILQQLNAEQI